MTKKVLLLALIAFMLFGFVAPNAQSQVPKTLNFQGYFVNSSGVALNGTKTVTFNIYDALTGGAPLWQEATTTATFEGGYLNIILGLNSQINLPFNAQYYLEVVNTTDNITYPRIQLTNNPYSFRALVADSAMVAQTAHIANDVVDNAITTGKLADGAVTIEKIDVGVKNLTGDVEGTLPTVILKGDKIVERLPNGSITINKLDPSILAGLPFGEAEGEVFGIWKDLKIRDYVVTNRKLADGAVTSDKIADYTILGTDINQMGAFANQALVWNGTEWAPLSIDLQHAYNWNNIIVTENNRPVMIHNSDSRGIMVHSTGEAVSGVEAHIGSVVGILGYNLNSTYGIEGHASFFGQALNPTDYAGYFDGNVNILGTLEVGDIFSENGSATFENGTVLAKNIIALDTMMTSFLWVTDSLYSPRMIAESFQGGTFNGTTINGTIITGTEFQGGLFNGTTGTFSGAVTAPSFVGGTFAGTTVNGTVGTFSTSVNSPAFVGGTFTGTTINGTIITGTEFQGGLFNGTTGTFSGAVTAPSFVGGTFAGTTVNGTVGTFSTSVNSPAFVGGTFNGTIVTAEEFQGGLFNGTTVNGTVGTFSTSVNSPAFVGGTFNGTIVTANEFQGGLFNGTTVNGTIGTFSTSVNSPSFVGGTFAGTTVNGTIGTFSTSVNSPSFVGGTFAGTTVNGTIGTFSTSVNSPSFVGGTFAGTTVNGTVGTFSTSVNAPAFIGGTFNGTIVTATEFQGGLFNGTTGNFSGDVTAPNFRGNLVGGTVSGTTANFTGTATFGGVPYGIDVLTNAIIRNNLEVVNDATIGNTLFVLDPTNVWDLGVKVNVLEAISLNKALIESTLEYTEGQIARLDSTKINVDAEFGGDVYGTYDNLLIRDKHVTYSKLQDGSAAGNVLFWNGTNWEDIALNSDNVVEGTTNLFFTNARARAAISVDLGTPLLYNVATGEISITPVSNTTNGYLSSTDYIAFNNKADENGPNNFIGEQHFETITLQNTHPNGLPENVSDALNELYDLSMASFEALNDLSLIVVYRNDEFTGDVQGSLEGGLFIQEDAVTFDKIQNGTALNNIIAWNGTQWAETTVTALETDPKFTAALSTDSLLAAASDVLVPSQRAVKSYADSTIKRLLTDPNFFRNTNTFGFNVLDDTALVAINNSITYPTVLFQNTNVVPNEPAIALEIRGKQGTASLHVESGDVNVSNGRLMVNAISDDQGLVFLSSQGSAPALEIYRGGIQLSYLTVECEANLDFGATQDLRNSTIIEVTANGSTANNAVLYPAINGAVISIINHSGNAITIPYMMDLNDAITINANEAATLLFSTTGWVRVR